MNIKLLLVKSITLLYRESQLSNNVENSAQLIKGILSNIRLPEISIGIDSERDIIDGLVKTAQVMCDSPLDHIYEQGEMLQRLKVNTLDEESLYDALYDGMVPELTEAQLKRTCLNLKRTLNNHFREERVQEIMNKATQTLKFNRNKIVDMKAFVAETMAALEPYQLDASSKDPAVITEVNMSNLEEITHVFKDVKKMDSGVGLLKTGYQGINRMLDGGFRRGEEVVIGALQHKYKTGFSLSLFKQIALYNIPQMIDVTKKPLLLRISFEDNLTLNFQFLYQSLKENETGVAADISGLSDEEMAAYIQERLAVNGYHTRFLFVNPSLWSYKDVCNKILELEAEGYEVHMCMLDYLLKLPTTGCDQGAAGIDIKNMFERIRNFMSSRGITFITPHQLSTEAKMMIRDGRTDFVKELVGRGYYAGCKQLDVVVDLEIFIHIEVINGESYLTVQRGKHRKIGQTPIEDQYCVLKFHNVGGILDDINGLDTTCKKVGGGPIGSGNESPFWDLS